AQRRVQQGRGGRARRRAADCRQGRGPATGHFRAGEDPRLDAVRAPSGDREPRRAVPPAHHAGAAVNAVWTIARRELKALFDLPTAYILLVVFVATNDFLFFRQAELYGVATLRPMLDLLPWLLLFLVPAVTMRALAEDARSGVLEVVLAQPITELELLLGKYVGQVLFLWIALVLTVAIPLGLTAGSHPQWGVVIAQYVGAGLLTLGSRALGLGIERDAQSDHRVHRGGRRDVRPDVRGPGPAAGRPAAADRRDRGSAGRARPLHRNRARCDRLAR